MKYVLPNYPPPWDAPCACPRCWPRPATQRDSAPPRDDTRQPSKSAEIGRHLQEDQ